MSSGTESLFEIASEIRRISRLWLQPAYEFRKKAVDALWKECGFPEGMSAQILDNLFGKFDRSDLSRVLETASKGIFSSRERYVGLIFPANIPDPIVVYVFLALSSGSKCWVKFSRHSKSFGNVFLASIRSESPLMAPRVSSTTSRRVFYERKKILDCVVALGDDASLETIQCSLNSPTRFVGFGHRISAGFVFRSALRRGRLRETVERCARDLWLYDQRGCLSPQLFLVEGRARAFIDELKKTLSDLQDRFGPIRRPYEVSLNRKIFLDRLKVASLNGRKVVLEAAVSGGDGPVIYHLKKGIFKPSAVGQVIGVKAFRSFDKAGRELSRYKKVLRCVSVAGNRDSKAKVRRMFPHAAAIRICRAGEMQNPPIEGG